MPWSEVFNALEMKEVSKIGFLMFDPGWWKDFWVMGVFVGYFYSERVIQAVSQDVQFSLRFSEAFFVEMRGSRLEIVQT
jgi:hypothetical protein